MQTGPDFTNPAQVADRTISHNADNMPLSIVHSGTVTTQFVYDGEGTRAKKVVTGGSTTYYIGEHYEVKDGAATKYIFAGNRRIAKVTATDKYFYHKDHLGSSTVMTDKDASEIEYSDYLPFGHQREHTGTSVTDYRFTDQEYDASSGLYNYDARLYDPVIGRFIADPVTQDLYAPQLLNRYSYVGNNPLLYIDPTGNFRSAEWQRATVPGQVSFDYGVTAAENKQYLRAGLHFAAMVGEQVMFVLSAGAVQAEVAAAQTTGQALKVLAKEGAEEAIGAPLPANPKKLLKNSGSAKKSNVKVVTDPDTANVMVDKFKGGAKTRPITDRRTGSTIGENTEDGSKVIRKPHSDKGTPQQHWNLENKSTGTNIHVVEQKK